MAETTAEPLLLQRPVTAPRLYFLSPAEPKDRKTFDALVSRALAEVREDLHDDVTAARLLQLIGRTGKERHIKRLEHRIGTHVAFRLAKARERQPVKNALVSFSCVPVASERRLCGTLIVRAWGHVLRTTFDPELSAND
jgi:hypothetical protein